MVCLLAISVWKRFIEFFGSWQTLALTSLDSESWGKQINCQKICRKRSLNCIKQERDIRRYPRNWECQSAVFKLIKKWKWEILLKPNHDQVDQQKFLPQRPGKLFEMQRKTHRLLQLKYRTLGCFKMHNKEELGKKMGCMVESPENSHYYTSATKNPACHVPNSTETSLKTSGTKSFGVMRPKLSFLATTINVTFGEESTRPMMKGTPFLLWNMEVDRWCFGDVWATQARETWSKLIAR